MSLPAPARLQHIVPSGLILLVGIWVAYVSFSQQPSDAFLFPRIISLAFVGLAAWTFVKALLGWSRVGQGISAGVVVNLAPGLAVLLIYVFWGATAAGFYTATAIAFFVLLSLYDPASHRDAKTWIKRVIITAIFVAVMYGLFAKLLKVFTPREIFF